MVLEIIYNDERIFVHEDNIAGYDGCTILDSHLDFPPDEVEGMLGREYLLRVHAIKQAEASTILSGFVLTHGMLYEEARALDIDIIDLATEVAEKAREDIELEVSRRLKNS